MFRLQIRAKVAVFKFNFPNIFHNHQDNNSPSTISNENNVRNTFFETVKENEIWQHWSAT